MEPQSFCTAKGRCRSHHVHWAFPPPHVLTCPCSRVLSVGTHPSEWGWCPFSRWVNNVFFSVFPFSRTDDTIQKYYFNITNHFSWSPVEVTLGLYTSLCQYFSEQEKRWKTEGIIPLEETRPDQAVCLTQHLTAFGASLFVPPNSVQFIFPVSKTKGKLWGVATC